MVIQTLERLWDPFSRTVSRTVSLTATIMMWLYFWVQTEKVCHTVCLPIHTTFVVADSKLFFRHVKSCTLLEQTLRWLDTILMTRNYWLKLYNHDMCLLCRHEATMFINLSVILLSKAQIITYFTLRNAHYSQNYAIVYGCIKPLN